MARLLLISNSTLCGMGYLDHVECELRDFIGARTKISFVPFALYDRYAYVSQVRARLVKLGYQVTSVHDVSNPRRTIREAEVVFIGGGNTFRLLKGLYEDNLLESIRQTVKEGAIYVGSSAGAIVACPTLKTTKDMVCGR